MTDHITLPRAVVENVLAVLEETTYYTSCTRWSPSMTDECKAATTALRAALNEPVKHGCHCDLDSDMEPDGCVLDDGLPENCAIARRLLLDGKGKTDCEYWKPIKVKR